MYVLIIIVTMLLLCSGILVNPVNAYSRADMSGNVVNKEVIFGVSRSINQINLLYLTTNGQYWTVTCRRADANLGLCNSAEVGDFAFVYGDIASSPMQGCYSVVYPMSLAIVSKP